MAPAVAPTSSRKAGRTIAVIFLALVLDLLGFACILPSFPLIMKHYEAQALPGGLFDRMAQTSAHLSFLVGVEADSAHSVYVGGLLGSLFSLLQLCVSPLVGWAADRYGRRPVAVVSALGSVAAYLVWVFAGSFEMFVLARILGGSTRALVQLAVAMVADVTPPEGRTKGMAAVGVAFSVGFTAGPMLGAFLRSANVAALWPAHLPSPHPFAGVAVAALALGTASAAVVVFALAETLPHVQEHPAAASAPDRSGPTERSRAELDAMVWRVQAINVAYVFVFAGLEFLLAFLTAQRFDYTDRQNGQLLAFIGVASAVVQGGYLRRLGPKTDELRVAISGIGAMVVAHTIFAFANSTATLYVAAVCYAFASATVVSCLNSAVSLMAPPDAVARVLGHMRSGGQLGRTLGPAVFAAVFWGQGATIAYSAGAVCGLVPLLLTIWVRRPWLRHRAALLHSKAA